MVAPQPWFTKDGSPFYPVKSRQPRPVREGDRLAGVKIVRTTDRHVGGKHVSRTIETFDGKQWSYERWPETYAKDLQDNRRAGPQLADFKPEGLSERTT